MARLDGRTTQREREHDDWNERINAIAGSIDNFKLLEYREINGKRYQWDELTDTWIPADA